MRLSLAIASVLPLLASQRAEAQDAAFDLLRERAGVSWTGVPRKVLAFYYGWYARADFSGSWSHWEGRDERARTLGDSAHYPRLGPYDSHDPELVKQHCRWAREAGLDGLIASWWDPGDFHDAGLPRLLEEAEAQGLSVSAYFEIVPAHTREQAAERVTGLLRKYGEHPAWLRVDERPVLFVYGRALDQIGMDGWLWVISEVNRRLEGGAVFIGDEISRRAARVFDGVHTYNVTGHTAGMSAGELRGWARGSYAYLNDVAPGRITCATVIPGYDDTKLGREGERPTTDRLAGETYRVLWEEALAAGPDWVLVTSFNEWHEGSEIEPSVEHGERELKRTAVFARRFRELPPRAQPALAAEGPPPERLVEVRAAFAQRPVAVLPEGDSEGLWSLLASGIPTVGLEWSQVLDPRLLTPARFPVVLYAGGEEYRATVRDTDDVLRALQRYVDAGGILVALPSGPMPFYYARGAGAAEHWRRLGFPLHVARDGTPPGIATYEFAVVDRDVMQGLPETFPFPAAGDSRWRPLVEGRGPAVESWIVLRDPDGKSLGTAAGKVARGEGWLVYVWFRLADLDVGERLLLDVWAEVATAISDR